MAESLTQSSHKARSNARRLTRKGGVYYYRRRLPPHLGTDICLSLGTRNFRKAGHLAETLDAVFDRAVKTVTAPSELRAILKSYLEQVLSEDMDMRLTAPPGRSVYTTGARVDELVAGAEPVAGLSRSGGGTAEHH